MREITKTISLSVDGKPMDFRLAKPDDLLDAVELIRVRGENEKRAAEAARVSLLHREN